MTRGTSASAAVLSAKRSERVNSVDAVSPIVPSSADASSNRDSSASDRTDSSSSFGSIPSRRTVQLAARFSRRISGPNTMP